MALSDTLATPTGGQKNGEKNKPKKLAKTRKIWCKNGEIFRTRMYAENPRDFTVTLATQIDF